MRTNIDKQVQLAIRGPCCTIPIVHYAEHGKFVLSERLEKKLARADFLFTPVEDTELDSDAPIDLLVLYIFDCCLCFF